MGASKKGRVEKQVRASENRVGQSLRWVRRKKKWVGRRIERFDPVNSSLVGTLPGFVPLPFGVLTRPSLFPGIYLVEDVEDAVGVVGDGGGPVGEYSDHTDVAGEHVQHCQHVRVLRDGVGNGLEAAKEEHETKQ